MKAELEEGNLMQCARWPGVHREAGTEPRARAAMAVDRRDRCDPLPGKTVRTQEPAGWLQGKPKERQGAQITPKWQGQQDQERM